MSEQKLISPLLDGFMMGEPMSSHDGVVCCPAMRENSEEKYIVKIISVPASQKQLDALLLTGAYPDVASATDYFKEQAEDIVKEAEILKQLSKLEGFLPYDNWQIVPMEGSKLGYQVYLLSPYKRSLEKHLRRSTMTHLSAVNLGLDLCSALSVCRRAGFMHVDLKPGNIFLKGQREFRIGDLGFVKLSTLKYTSLPVKYCSSYTPPELHDALNTLNPTADIYAVGMILYQIYNNGVLPFDDKAPDEVLPPPLNADYELAEIILKACDPNPRKRYQTPIEMGQALVSYMQRNTVGDEPIVPPAAEADFLDAAYESAAESRQDPAVDETVPQEPDVQDLEHTPLTDEVSSILAQAEELMVDPDPEVEEPLPEPAQDVSETPAEPEDEIDWSLNAAPVAVADEPEEDEPEEVFESFEKPRKKRGFLAFVVDDEVEPEEDEPKEVFESFEKPRKKRGFLKFFITVLLLAAIGFGGFYFYQNYYLLHIGSMELTPVADTVQVVLKTDADDSLLTVVCTDVYGNSLTSGVKDKTAVFEGLTPGTLYKFEIVTEGFHGLSGSVTGTATTVDQTKIDNFTAQTGNEDGSVILEFSVEGPEQDWIVEYVTEGEELRSVSFTGHNVTVSNLTVGKTYTFTLVGAPGSSLYIVGNNTLEFTASAIVFAENLSIVSCADGMLTAVWDAPIFPAVESWTVRCYNESGFDETQTVTDTTAQFSGIASDSAYTVEVTAAGMTQGTRTYITANPTTVTDFTAGDAQNGKLALTWNSNVTPEGGWLLMYALDSGESNMVVKCTESYAIITPTVPGTTYHFTLQSADGSTVFGGTTSFTTAKSDPFNAKSINAEKVTGSFLPTPEKKNWTYKDIAEDGYSATHAVGSKVSLLLYSPEKASRSGEETSVMFVFRNAAGDILPELTSTVTRTWDNLWGNRSRYCSLDLPIIPSVAGEYTVEVYFNNALMISKTLTVTE